MTVHKLNQESLDIFSFGPITLGRNLTIEEFTSLAERHPDLQMEREKTGKTTIISPVKRGSGKRESIIDFYLRLWKYKTSLGEVFGASTGVKLPDGSFKSPDCAWVSDENLDLLNDDEENSYLNIAPDFIAEICSSTDRISVLQKKMQDIWMKNGVRLGWLIDPYQEKIYIYRQGKEVEILEGFKNRKLIGEDVMPEMELPLDEFLIKKRK